MIRTSLGLREFTTAVIERRTRGLRIRPAADAAVPHISLFAYRRSERMEQSG
jgi:hypothetical protein